MKQDKTVLVTGCAGFIGSHLCDALLAQGWTVIGIDNYLTGYQKNIEQAQQYDTFTFIEADVRDIDHMETIIQKHNVKYISHQAARASVPKSVDNPLLTNDINVTGTLNLLRLAHKLKTKKFVCAISSSVYGNTKTLPKTESMAYHPESPYAITKVAKEMYCKTFFHLYGLPTIGLRYFNVYGPRQDPQGAYAAVIPKWIQAAMNNEDLPLNGEGKQTRDFTYINDVVAINILALESDEPKSRGKGYNVCYGDRTSIVSVGETIITSLGSKSQLVHAPERKGDIQDSFGDTQLATTLLGYAPQHSIQDGIQKTIERYTQHPDYFIL